MSLFDKVILQEEQAEKVLCSLKGNNCPLVLWGCGDVAEHVYTLLTKNNIKVSDVYIDPPPEVEIEFHGINILGFVDICKKHKEFNIIVGHLGGYRMMDVLKDTYENIHTVYAIDLGILYDTEPICIDFIRENENLFEWTYNQLSDELSRSSYIAYLDAKINKSYGGLFPFVCEGQYFCRDIIRLGSNEVFVDCGAYDGDSVADFITIARNYEAIYAMEPDQANFNQLLSWQKKAHNLTCVKKGVWNKREILKFNSEGTMNSSVSDIGNTIIEVDTIDNILEGKRASLIKMDIEGAELNALRGAEKTIIKYKPKLAICAYHKANDLIAIPKYIKSLIPDYKLYFRIHKCGTIDSVLYAVCDN